MDFLAPGNCNSERDWKLDLISLRRQSHLNDSQLLEDIQHADHMLIVHVVSAFDDHGEVRIVRLQDCFSLSLS